MTVVTDGGRYAMERLTCSERGWQALQEATVHRSRTVLTPGGGHLWGVFAGLFGIASNELFVVSWAPGTAPQVLDEPWPDEVEAVERRLMAPTVRPTQPDPLVDEGLYVLRFFSVDHATVDEIVELSRTAWTTFEGGGDYRSEPKGLFCQVDRSASRGVMLLVTWYDGFGSWEISRTPPAAAMDNFRRRHLLTHGTVAYATRLVTADGGAGSAARHR